MDVKVRVFPIPQPKALQDAYFRAKSVIEKMTESSIGVMVVIYPARSIEVAVDQPAKASQLLQRHANSAKFIFWYTKKGAYQYQKVNKHDDLSGEDTTTMGFQAITAPNPLDPSSDQL